jgi:hypothetical protein
LHPACANVDEDRGESGLEDRRALLLAWLEGEGARQRRKLVLRRGVQDAYLRGWVELGVCVVAGLLASGVLVCAMAKARLVGGTSPSVFDIANANLSGIAGRSFDRIVVIGTVTDAQPGDRVSLPILILSPDGVGGRVACEFPQEQALHAIRPGDRVAVLTATPAEQLPDRVHLRECKLVGWKAGPAW